MPIHTDTRSGALLRGLAVAAAMIAAPALAQEKAAPDRAGRAWTDPPVHGAAAPAEGSAGTASAKVERKAETPAAAPAEARPAASRQGRAERAAVRTRPPARTAAHPSRTRAARPSDDRSRTVRVAASARPPAPPRSRGFRMVTLRPDPAGFDAPPPYRPVVIVRPAPGFAGPFEEDDRARRIRLARESGYTLIRARTYRFPDGRRWQTFSPDDVDD